MYSAIQLHVLPHQTCIFTAMVTILTTKGSRTIYAPHKICFGFKRPKISESFWKIRPISIKQQKPSPDVLNYDVVACDTNGRFSPFGVANTFRSRIFSSFTPCSKRTLTAVMTVAPESAETKRLKFGVDMAKT